jgi:hypothetical protein
VVGHFHHAQLVGTATEIEEAEVGQQAAAHHLIGGDGGVEAARHQYQGLLDGAQRVAAEAFVLSVDDQQTVVAHLEAHLGLGLLEIDPGGTALAAQAAADVAGQLHRGEVVGVAGALAAHGEALARQLVAEMRTALLEGVVEIDVGVFVYFEEMGDARHVAQALEHFRLDLRLAHPADQVEVVPFALHVQLGVQVAQHRANVLRQLADELLAHRPALDGDFCEGFDDQFHEQRAPGERPKNRGADYSGNCSSFDQKQSPHRNSTKKERHAFLKHEFGAQNRTTNRHRPRSP